MKPRSETFAALQKALEPFPPSLAKMDLIEAIFEHVQACEANAIITFANTVKEAA